ncbi:MAG: peptide deformylase [Bacteroidales bacterium]|nr:peptide deformylase [Bacteroidales bacterium]
MNSYAKRLTLIALLVLLIPMLILAVIGAFRTAGKDFSIKEKTIIEHSDSVMYVTVINNPADSVILRTLSRELSVKALKSETFRTLAEKMRRTVTDPSQDGVGIAAPQVGVNKRVIWVMRLDKEGEPMELYANPVILSRSEAVVDGEEGCLSIPGLRGSVSRSVSIEISYTSLETFQTVTETVEGYTARIFQHECDHLDGILFIDRIKSRSEASQELP